MNLQAYLQHGKPGGPYRTESVEVKDSPMQHHIAGLSWTATGYGARIPTSYMVRYCNKWRRVYACCYSNIGTLFIGRNIRGGIIVRIDEF